MAGRRTGQQALWALACGAVLTAAAAASGLLGHATQLLEDHALARATVPAAATVVDWGAAPVPAEAHARLLQRLADAGVRQVLYLPALPTPPSPALSPAPAPAGILPELTASPVLAQSLRRVGTLWLRAEMPAAAQSATPLTALQRRSTLPDPGAAVPQAAALQYPHDAWLGASAGAAPWRAEAEKDGRLRRIPLVWRHDTAGVPSLALLAALGHWHLSVRDVQWQESPSAVQWGGVRLPVDAQARLRPVWGEDPPSVAAQAVMDGAVAPRLLEDRTVVVGAARQGAGALMLPDGRVVSEAQALAHVVSAIRHGAVISVPSWSHGAVGLGLAGVAVALFFGCRRGVTRPWIASATVLVACGLCIGVQWLAFAAKGWSLPFALAVPVLLAGGALGAWAQTLLWERTAGRHDPAHGHDEAERMLGLVRQGQGDWRGALRHYQRAHVTPALLDNLLHLALDLERQQQWPQARQVYEFLLRRDRHHAEARKRYRQLRARLLQDAAAAPSPEPTRSAAPLPSEIGPYRVDALLGQGAMGAVYRAHDAQIGRPVALKTMALSQEFDGEVLAEARGRFLREAKAAGRLQHPGIVTVYGAGEEQGVAYIAMEYLPGSDLAARAVTGHLLPVEQVLALGADVALALDYAHQHQVIHRDIKPANLRWNPETGQVKVVDFGVARITDSLRTRTGLVLGTPSFMSPEQVQGQHVDGRSDLYALGVTLFQLLTGQLPLRADSLPQLLHAIVTAPAPDVRSLRPELPAAVAELLDRALAKSPQARFQTGRVMAQALLEANAALVGASGGRGAAAVDYHPRQAHGDDGFADFQETVMESRATDRDLHPISSTGAP